MKNGIDFINHSLLKNEDSIKNMSDLNFSLFLLIFKWYNIAYTKNTLIKNNDNEFCFILQ